MAALLTDGHEIPTAHLADSTVTDLEARVSAREVFERDVAWIRAAEALIAEVSIPSHGVGYEVGLALAEGKKVLCLSLEGRKISKMITGNSHPGLRARTYKDSGEAIRLAREFIGEIG